MLIFDPVWRLYDSELNYVDILIFDVIWCIL